MNDARAKATVIAFILEIVVATAIAAAIWNSGHPVWAIVLWILVMSLSNFAYDRK